MFVCLASIVNFKEDVGSNDASLCCKNATADPSSFSDREVLNIGMFMFIFIWSLFKIV